MELLNPESVANMLASNNMCSFVKLDVRSLLKHKIRFVRVCVRVDITEPLLEYAEVDRAGGVTSGYVFWYEDFSMGAHYVGMRIIVLRSAHCYIPRRKSILLSSLKTQKRNG